ncbi:hypothetical protein QZH41_014438 [Actinostola sp. cb2023]|nr:hypothetical protein QZH41_014438 [Actinostola sp. cb2023]
MADNKSLEIRKLRKKLRQIEHLEQVDRDLTQEEYSKVRTKDKVRKELQKLVAERDKAQKHAQKMTNKPQDNAAESEAAVSEEVSGRNGVVIAEEFGEAGVSGTQDVAENGDKSSSSSEVRGDNTVSSSSSSSYKIAKSSELSTATATTSSSSSSPSSSSLPSTSSSPSLVASRSSPSSSKSSPSSSKSSPPSSVVKSTKQSSSQKSAKLSQAHKEWVDSMFSVQFLEGHNDYISDVDCDETVVISGSRDTTLKLWDADTGLEIRSMGGHTGTVTSVKLIPNIGITLDEEAVPLSKAFQHMAITGSKDCSIRIWSLGDGQMRRSIYTYSSVECLDYNKGIIASGSEGGKVELWDANTGDNIRSIKGHEDIVTCIKFQDNGRVVSGSMAGVVKVWDIRDRSLQPIFDSENSDIPYKKRQIRSLATNGDNIYWGDDGANIKVLELASGKLRKIRNHENDFGSTNAMTTTGSCLISAGYDIDNGKGYMNVRSLPDEAYLATINDNNTSCITCLSCSQIKKEGQTLNRLCTGGSDLKLWNQLPSRVNKRTRSESDDGFVTTKHIRRYSQPDLSDTESSEEDDDDDPRYDDDDGDDDDAADNASRSWCTIS